MVKGRKNVDNDMDVSEGALLDGLPPRYGPSPVLKFFCQRHVAQLGLLHDPGFPQKIHNGGTHPVPWAMHAVTLAPTRGTDHGRPYFC